MRNTSVFRISVLFSAIANMLRNPLMNDKKYDDELKNYRRELHFAIGENPIFIPRRKHKGYMKQHGRKKGYSKFQKH